MAANGFEFQSELARAIAFQMAYMSATAQALEDFLSGLAKDNLSEIRREGLRQMRLGSVEAIAAFALFIRSPRLSDASREIVAKALARHAATPARSIQPADRLANAANARASLPALNAAARTNVETFIAAMSDAGCEALCAIP